MGNIVEFILRLTDQLSPAMRSAAAVSDKATAGMSASVDAATKRVRKSMNEAAGGTESAASRMSRSAANAGSAITRDFDEASSSVDRFSKKVTRARDEFGRFVASESRGGGGSSGVGRWLVGLTAGISAFTVAQQAFAQAANAENQQIAFKVLTGSPKTGNELYKNIVDLADRTPYESQDLARSAKTMLGYGVATKDIMPTLNMLGDIAAAADSPASSLQSLALAFGQVQAKGHLAGQEALQLINAGFNPLKEIADITHMKMNDLDKAMEKGAISADMVRLAFQHATGPGGKFHDMMKEQSQTLGGRWSTFMDGVHHKLRSLGEALAPVARGAMDFGTALLNLEAPALAITTAVAGITLALTWNSIAAGYASIRLAIFNAVMNANPIVLVISLLVALGIWIYSVSKKYEGWGQTMRATWEIIKAFVGLNLLAWKSFGETVWYWVQYGWLKFKGFFEWVGGALNNIGNAFELVFKGRFKAAKDALTAEIITPSAKALDELQKKHAASQTSYAQEAAALTKSIADNYAKMGVRKIAATGTTNPVEATSTTAAPNYAKAFGSLSEFDSGKEKADKVNKGGQRSIIVNIGKQIETLQVHVMNGKETADEIYNIVQEQMRRVMYSLNGVQPE